MRDRSFNELRKTVAALRNMGVKWYIKQVSGRKYIYAHVRADGKWREISFGPADFPRRQKKKTNISYKTAKRLIVRLKRLPRRIKQISGRHYLCICGGKRKEICLAPFKIVIIFTNLWKSLWKTGVEKTVEKLDSGKACGKRG
jgi:hypothetical protein